MPKCLLNNSPLRSNARHPAPVRRILGTTQNMLTLAPFASFPEVETIYHRYQVLLLRKGPESDSRDLHAGGSTATYPLPPEPPRQRSPPSSRRKFGRPIAPVFLGRGCADSCANCHTMRWRA